MKMFIGFIVLLGTACAPQLSMSVSPAASVEGLMERVSAGQYIRVTALSTVQGRVLAATDSTIQIVGSETIYLSQVKKVEVRSRDGRKGALIGGAVGGILGGTLAVAIRGLDTSGSAPSKPVAGLLGAFSVGGLGALIGTGLSHTDAWHTVWEGR